VGSFFTPDLDGEATIRSLKGAWRWLQIILFESPNERNFYPMSCAY
jgi:hypothetical protein